MQKIAPLKIIPQKLKSVSILDNIEANPPPSLEVERKNKFTLNLFKNDICLGRLLICPLQDIIAFHKKVVINLRHNAIGVDEVILYESKLPFENMIFSLNCKDLRTDRTKFCSHAIIEKDEYGVMCYLQLHHIPSYIPKQLELFFNNNC